MNEGAYMQTVHPLVGKILRKVTVNGHIARWVLHRADGTIESSEGDRLPLMNSGDRLELITEKDEG